MRCYTLIHAGVLLSLNNQVVPNNSNLTIDDIGRDVNNALICHTGDGSGRWYHSSGQRVRQFYYYSPPFNFIPTLMYVEGGIAPNEVHLYREGVPPVLGEFSCQVSRGNSHTKLTVNISKYSFTCNEYTVFIMIYTASHLFCRISTRCSVL